MKLNPLMLFSFFGFETPLKDFQYVSPILLILWLRYLQTRKKVNCMYLSSQSFFKTPEWNSKIPRKFKKNELYSDLQT